MSVTVTLKVTHDYIPSVIRAIDEWGRNWADDASDWATLAIKAEAPVGKVAYIDNEGHSHPGWLRESVDRVHLPGNDWRITVHAFYGIYVNNGTRHMAPNPFFDRAVERVFPEAARLGAVDLRADIRAAIP